MTLGPYPHQPFSLLTFQVYDRELFVGRETTQKCKNAPDEPR